MNSKNLNTLPLNKNWLNSLNTYSYLLVMQSSNPQIKLTCYYRIMSKKISFCFLKFLSLDTQSIEVTYAKSAVFTLFRTGGTKRPPTSFFPVTSTNVEISFQNLLTFSFKPFGTLVWSFKAIPSASFKL